LDGTILPRIKKSLPKTITSSRPKSKITPAAKSLGRKPMISTSPHRNPGLFAPHLLQFVKWSSKKKGVSVPEPDGFN